MGKEGKPWDSFSRKKTHHGSVTPRGWAFLALKTTGFLKAVDFSPKIMEVDRKVLEDENLVLKMILGTTSMIVGERISTTDCFFFNLK